LLSSQGTDASFVLTPRYPLGFPPGFRSVLAFPTLPDHFRAVSGGGFEFGDRWGSLPFGAPPL
ncbi:hypothetical protein, partial [Streptomyces sp. NPDC092307]|uniref:hypothetical protein n=1 Tax=Streptomyces sp. NPDC092307 TaxID=3366013 RepID=UPI00380CF6D1